MKNDKFRSHFLSYFRNGQLSKTDKLLSRISPRFVYKKNASVISDMYKHLEPAANEFSPRDISIENYTGSNPVAKKISAFLEEKAKRQLVGTYVHGSIGTSEEIPYSDFDGLVIIKNSCFQNPTDLFFLLLALKETEQMMKEMDPLQHHGWFVMNEADLENYPEHYFPHELFMHAKCLFGNTRLKIGLRTSGYRQEFEHSFQHLTGSIQRKLQSKSFLENYYVLKNLLSEFMLLPAIYHQAKTGNGIFKKFSFDMLEKEAGEKGLVMKKISAIRNSWNYTPTEQFSRLNIFAGSSAAKADSGSIATELKNKFDDEMIGLMNDLVNDLKSNLQS
ncbi:MAG: hypothetical protein ABI763_16835 [Bacteroidota bacterium]